MSTVGDVVETVAAAADEVDAPVWERTSSLLPLDVGLFALVVLSLLVVTADLLR
jgi:hypothetical protein